MFPTSKNQSDGSTISHAPDNHDSRIFMAWSRSSSSSDSSTHLSKTEASGTKTGYGFIGRDLAESIARFPSWKSAWSYCADDPADPRAAGAGSTPVPSEEQH